ncbi:MAG: hypothetical protein J6Q15_00185, partial [Clostridia bacterium]|nr:hypothetical protein [Clostridia bacterium]
MAINGSKKWDILVPYASTAFAIFDWERTSYSTNNMTSTISWTYSISCSGKLFSSTADFYYELTVDGQGYSGTKSLTYKNGTYLIASGTTIIQHGTDGTKNFMVTTREQPPNAAITTLITTFALDKITKASGVTCTTVNIGVAPVITINSQDSSYRHTLTYGFGDQEQGYKTGMIVSLTNKSVIDYFIWPEVFYQFIPNSRSGTGVIYCETYNSNGEMVGEQTRCNFTANVNEGSSTPVFASGYPKIKDINSITKALTGDENTLVRYVSTAYVEIGAEGRNYATIARQKVKNDTAIHEEYTNDLVSISFGNVVSPVFSFELEDSRGYITKPGRDLSATGRFVEYFHPTCNIGNNKPDTHGNLTINCSGSWFNSSFGAVDNSITVEYRYKLEQDEWKNTEDEWFPMAVTVSGNSYDATASFMIPNFDYLAGYVYEARVKDKIFTTHSTEYNVKSAAIFSWSDQDFEFNVPVKFNAGVEGIEGGGGSGSGSTGDLSAYALKSDNPTVLPNPYELTINGQTYDGTRAVTIAGGGSDLSSGGTVNGDLTITGNLRLKGAGNYGNILYFGDGAYATISEPSDDTLTVNATNINLHGNVKVNGSAISSG